MSVSKPVAKPPSVPRVLGVAICFLTMGVGVLRSVEPKELLVRAFTAGFLTWIATRQFADLFQRMVDDSSDKEEAH